MYKPLPSLDITTAGTYQVQTGNAKLIAITVNTSIGGTIKVIDDIAGTTANFTITTIAGTAPVTLHYYGKTFSKGVRVITSANDNITIVWDR